MAVALAAVIATAGCARERAETVDEPCVSWRDDLEAIFSTRCVECHGADAPAGDYDLRAYTGVLGGGSDGVANAIAGDAGSLLLEVLEPGAADPQHGPLSDLHGLLSRWVVDCELSYARSLIHPGGLMNPSDDDFHGRLLRDQDYRFEICAECHGEDFEGGSSGAGCTTCHALGPTDCTTCHGAVPESGAHLAHVQGPTLGRAYECQTCHRIPVDYTDPGHLWGADGSLDEPPAEVEFDDLASRGGGPRPPSYDPESGRCSDVYCHGATLGDENAGNTAPIWTDPDQAECGACHGLGPAGHADERCSVCHPTAIAGDGTLDPSRHLDGLVAVGRGTGECDDCHGDGPPPDLAGNTATDVVTVGAHQSHVEAAHDLRGPIPCSDCHPDIGELFDPGHIDSAGPAEVFTGAGLAAAGGAQPVWDRDSATCSDVYCHGGGTTRLGTDLAVGILRTPEWTAVGADQAACGACHGVPPVDGIHDGSMTLTTCRDCHPGTVDDFGNIIISGPPGQETSDHINGTFDF